MLSIFSLFRILDSFGDPVYLVPIAILKIAFFLIPKSCLVKQKDSFECCDFDGWLTPTQTTEVAKREYRTLEKR